MVFNFRTLIRKCILWTLITLALNGCSTEATNSILQNVDFFSKSILASIEVIDNSTTQGQSQCAQGNRVTLQVSLPKEEVYFCADQSKLIDGVNIGQTCPGGISILDFPVRSTPVDCRELTICGVKPSKKIKVGDRFDGGVIEEWSFESLPWGCNIDLRYDDAEDFDISSAKKLNSQVLAPECPFCPTANIKTCLACDSLDDNKTIVHGQVVFKDCNGSNCSDCQVDGKSVQHGQGILFYSKNKGQCGAKCVDSSAMRVCNNGFFEGDPGKAYSQCADTLCGCTLPGKTTTYDSGTVLDLYTTQKPACGKTCMPLQVRCDDGVWNQTSDNKVVDADLLKAHSQTTCTNPVCHCVRTPRPTIMEGGTASVYEKNLVGCTESCTSVQGTVQCDKGTLTAGTASHLDYKYDSCKQDDCGCRVNLANNLQIYIPNGSSRTLFTHPENNLSKLDACTDPKEQIKVTCNNNVLTPSLTSQFQYQSCKTKTFACTYGGSPQAVVQHMGTLTVFPTGKPNCSQKCQATSIRCNNGSFEDGVGKVLPQNFTVDLPSSTCVEPKCTCDVNGFKIPYGQSKTFYNTIQGTCDPASCNNASATISCNNGIVSGGDPLVYTHETCSPKQCSCSLPFGGSLLNGASGRAYRINAATCNNINACNSPVNHTSISCTNGVLSAFDASTFKYGSCSTPQCGCSHAGVMIDHGQNVWFYKTQTPAADESCGDVGAEFTCTSTGGLVSISGSDIPSDYQHSTCESLFDTGSLGGTGGGTGNDEGPGSALKPRKGASNGGGTGGGGGPCFNALHCRVEGVSTPFRAVPRRSCELPWGDGEIEFYGSIIAFSQQCVVAPDRCEKYRQSRTCTYKGMSGSQQFRYESCEEKPSCP